MKRLLIIVLFYWCNLGTVVAQEFEGSWRGRYVSAGGVVQPQRVDLEMHAIDATHYTGVLHLYYRNNGFEHTKVSGTYDPKAATFLLLEDSAISYRLGLFSQQCLGNSLMRIRRSENEITLYGIWVDKKKGIFKCPNQPIQYELQLGEKDSLPPAETKDTLPPVETAEPKADKRITDVQKVIDVTAVEADSIRFDVYDSGTIDGDSISVYFNDRVVLSNQGISAKPITFYVSLNKNIPFNKVTMKALNLGSIPPNTAYMVITTKKKTYRLSLNSDLKKSGTIEFTIL